MEWVKKLKKKKKTLYENQVREYSHKQQGKGWCKK
jgi:hypothetical protein